MDIFGTFKDWLFQGPIIDFSGIKHDIILVAIFGFAAIFLITGLGRRTKLIIGIGLLMAGAFVYFGG